MKKISKLPIIKKIIELQPDHPGTISKQQFSLKSGKKSRIYWLWQTSKAGQKISIRLKEKEVAELKSFITELKRHNKLQTRKDVKSVGVFKSEISKLSQENLKGGFENEK